MKHYTDTQLKQLLAKMLPETITFQDGHLWHRLDGTHHLGASHILDTQLLHLAATARISNGFKTKLMADASWQEQVQESFNSSEKTRTAHHRRQKTNH
jgi:hypothetical protein